MTTRPRPSRWRRALLQPWLLLPVVALVAAGGWFAFGRKDDTGSPAPTAAIERTVAVTSGPLTRTVSASGTIAAAETDDLSFASAGTVTAVNVKAGDAVKKGQVLATIDSAALASAVSQAQASVADAAAKLASDQTASATTAQLTADQSDLASLQAQQIAAQTALDGATLVSPIDGTISVVNLTVGQQLGGGGTSGVAITGTGTGSGRSSSTLGSGFTGSGGAATQGSSTSSPSSTQSSSAQVEVISTGTYVAKLDVDDTSIQNVKIGQQATIALSSERTTNPFAGFFRRAAAGSTSGQGASAQAGSTPQPAAAAAVPSKTGIVTSVGTVASATSGVATFPVEVTFTGSAGTYHPGATAQVDITYSTIPSAIQVPAQAVTTGNGGPTVVVITNGKKRTRPVQTGITSNGMVQITSGLKAGDQVVLSIPAPRRVTTGSQTGGGFQPAGGFNPAGRTGGGFARGGTP